MPSSMVAAARTPCAPRHGALSDMDPVELVATAMSAAAKQAGLGPGEVELIIVACDNPVGAQALNVARRAGIAVGWTDAPAVTVDGQGLGDLAALALGGATGATTIVASLDTPSLVPPGAGLVRDYGRPSITEPDTVSIDRMARAAGLTRARLDTALMALVADVPGPSWVVPVALRHQTVVSDVRVTVDGVAGLPPLCGEEGLLTAAHVGVLADGAAAVVLAPGGRGRGLDVQLAAVGDADAQMTVLRELTEGRALLADANVAVHLLSGLDTPAPYAVASVPALGSWSSGDGLRLIVDAFHGVPDPCTIVRRGDAGQVASASLGPRGG